MLYPAELLGHVVSILSDEQISVKKKDQKIQDFLIFLFTEHGISDIINRTMQTLRNE